MLSGRDRRCNSTMEMIKLGDKKVNRPFFDFIIHYDLENFPGGGHSNMKETGMCLPEPNENSGHSV